jgi:formylmethanofuran dehydrogenase subunit E
LVKGLDIFREFFAPYSGEYVLIGGTAASLAMEEAGLEFRSTKDLDIVLYVEAVAPTLGKPVA